MGAPWPLTEQSVDAGCSLGGCGASFNHSALEVSIHHSQGSKQVLWSGWGVWAACRDNYSCGFCSQVCCGLTPPADSFSLDSVSSAIKLLFVEAVLDNI